MIKKRKIFKMKKEHRTLLIGALLLLFSVILTSLIRNEIVSAVIYWISFIIFLKLDYKKGEFYLFLIGLFLGIIMEIGGNLINQMQYWSSGMFFGIPIWLPILWGYAFVFMRRIGKLVVKD
jgi:hypothetical protein